MKLLAAGCLILSVVPYVAISRADTFGSGANTFEIEFVPIYNPDGPAGEHGCGRGCSGNVPGNPPDTEYPGNIGSVAYFYRMGKYEISEQMIDKANASGTLGITKDARGPDKPATSIDWFEAAQFVNWLNTSTGHMPAYKLNPRAVMLPWEITDPGYNPGNVFRNSLAKYFLPSADEWYKAAYYDPTTPLGTWYDYPTGSDAPPTPVAGGTDPSTAVYLQNIATGPADIMNAGGLSPYGTMAQGGNVYEWNETEIDFDNDSPIASRIVRGGFWEDSSFSLSVSANGSFSPLSGSISLGFRIASIPEPSTSILVLLFSLSPLMCRSIQ